MESLPQLKVGWIGTGVMGFHMCKHLLKRGCHVQVYNRTKSKADSLVLEGAKWTQPSQMAKSVDVLIIMLGYPRDVQEVCLGQKGLISNMKPGAILVDHTSSKSSLARTLYEQSKKRDISSIDAPVSGGDIGAQQGQLVTMCGGDQQAIDRIRPFLNAYSRAVNHHGKAGAGQQTKMTNQIVLANNMAGVVQGLMFASKMNLDLKKTIETICLGGAASTALRNLGPRIVDGDLNPGFYVEHYLKDMEIALEEAARVDLCLPCFSLIKQFYCALKAQGGGRLGSQALVKVIQNFNNHRIKKQ